MTKSNQESYEAFIEKYSQAEKKAHAKRTKVNSRISMLIDKGSKLFEFSSLAGLELYPGIKDSGIVTGIGIVNKKPCIIIANNPEVKAGCYSPITIKKTIRALKIAKKQKLPCLFLVDSGGAYLPMQAELFANEDGFGRIFYHQSKLQAAGIAQYSAILGSCTAGGAYVPILGNACVMVKEKSSLFLAGPPLVKAALGADVDAQELGGSIMHCHKSGVVEQEVETEQQAIQWLREMIERVPYNKQFKFSKQSIEVTQYIEQDTRFLPDIKKIIHEIIDHNSIQEFQPKYGITLITTWAKIDGRNLGIIANNGILTTEAIKKSINFISECNAINIPILFLHNTHGMMVGMEAEESSIAKYGAKLIQTISNCKVRKITIMIGNSYGAGNYAMAGRAFETDFIFQWPNNKTGVMGPNQQAQVLASIGKKADIDTSTHCAIYNSIRLNDDGIIHPNETRNTLAFLLNLPQQETTDAYI